MINIEKNNGAAMDGDNMTNEEMIHKIMERTGVTREQAQEAIDKNNGDLLDAMIYVERTYGQASKAAYTEQTAPQYGADYQNSSAGYNNVSAGGYEFKSKLETVKNFLLVNSLVIKIPEGREFSVPLLACVIALLVSCNAVLVAVIVSLFFGVRYRLSGPKFSVSKVNTVFDTIYGMAQNLKASFSETR